MKQTIGYLKYDYMVSKSTLWQMLLICGVLGIVFAKMSSPLYAIGYMLFVGLISASTVFHKITQTVSFTALMPGGALQKVLGRYLWCLICLGCCLLFGTLGICIARWVGFVQGVVGLADLLMVLGVTLFFLAFQNTLMYLLVPFLGMQLLGLIRMVPGFILFFGMMHMGDSPFLRRLMQDEMLLGMTMMGVGALSMMISIVVSWLAVRNRDNE